MSTRTGPFEQGQWPNRLRAAAVDASDRPRLHGYDIESDLARHYGAAELMLLALTQDAPTVHQGKAFEIALVFASTCPINEAPTHGARLARSFGAPVASAVTAGILLAFEASRAVIDEHRELLQWLRDGREGLLPPSVRAKDARDEAAVEQLGRALAGADVPWSPLAGATRMAAILAVMWECGLESDDQLLLALSWARTVSIAAESVAVTRGGLVNFPALLPNFVYEAPTP